MKTIERLTDTDKCVIRRVMSEIARLRGAVRPDADLVDAMCSLDVSFASNHAARVAMRCAPALPKKPVSLPKTCSGCGKVIKGKATVTNPSILEISLGISRVESFHPRCFAKAWKAGKVA